MAATGAADHCAGPSRNIVGRAGEGDGTPATPALAYDANVPPWLLPTTGVPPETALNPPACPETVIVGKVGVMVLPSTHGAET